MEREDEIRLYYQLDQQQMQRTRDDYARWRWEFMSKEERKEVDTFFKEKMKHYCKEYNVKVRNDGITFFDIYNIERGQLSFSYNSFAAHYGMSMRVSGGELADFFERFSPGFLKSRRTYYGCYFGNEKKKEFCDTKLGMMRKIPEESREEFAERAAKRIMKVILPIFFDIMHVRPSLFATIIQYPINVRNPIVVYLYLARKYGLNPEIPFVKRIFTVNDAKTAYPSYKDENYIPAFEKRLYAGEFDDIIEAYKDVGKGENYVNVTLKTKKTDLLPYSNKFSFYPKPLVPFIPKEPTEEENNIKRLSEVQKQRLNDDRECWRWISVSKEEKKEFDRSFKEKMKIYCKDYNIKATHECITFFDSQKKKQGKVWVYLGSSREECHLKLSVFGGEIAELLNRVKSTDLYADRSWYSQWYGEEKKKEFSTTAEGIKKLPGETIEELVERVIKRVINVIFPIFFDIMHVRPFILNHIIQYPVINYGEPIITYLYVARKYGFNPETPFVKRIFTVKDANEQVKRIYEEKKDDISAFEKRLYAGEFDDIIEAYKDVGKGDNYVNMTLKTKK